jgi:diacylglycerol kinase (ATP)
LRAAAILGPNATKEDVSTFEASGERITISSEINSSFDAVLIFGGDGTIHRHLCPAVTSRVPVLCVPVGSGNDFARALGIRSVSDALAAWRAFRTNVSKVSWVDVGEISYVADSGPSTSLYCCIAGIGLDSEVNRRANRLPSWLRRHGGYVVSLPAALLSFIPPTVKVEIIEGDHVQRIHEPAMLVAFANAPSYGHGMRIAPRAALDDGKLDVCFVRRTSKLRLLRLFPKVYAGSHLSFRETEYAQCSALRVESDCPLDLFADGEYIGRTPSAIRVLPRALSVIVPAQISS